MSSLNEQCLTKLKEIIDPELGINIVDLGLIYNLLFQNKQGENILIDDKKNLSLKELQVEVIMTLTSPMCPVGPIITDEVKKKIDELAYATKVSLVWEPPWSQDKLSDEVKIQLGLW